MPDRIEGSDCPRCCGNGEIVTDWDRYLHPRTGDVGDEAVADCPDCDGTGRLLPVPALTDSDRPAHIPPDGKDTRPQGLKDPAAP